MNLVLNKVNFIVSVSCHGGVHKPGLELVSRLGSRSVFSEMSFNKCIVSKHVKMSVDMSLGLFGD